MRLMLAISAGEWEGIQHRPHHFMKRSAKSGWTVLYLEPPATIISPLKNKKMLNRWTNWLKGLRMVEENIYLLAPPPTLPFGNKYRFVNRINQWLIAKTVNRALKSFKQLTVDLYSFLPSAVDMLPFIKIEKLVYDCVDDHAAFTGLINKAVIMQMEKELMERANVSFATAKQLMEERKAYSESFYLIPNGAEYEHFANAPSNIPIPTDIKDISRPIVGFVGGISDWIDIPLITAAAESMTDVSFVFIGPVATDIEALNQLPNTTFLGAKPYRDLPLYIKEFTTCLIPFKINKLTASVNPIKMYEYLSAGKPVVSTALPEVIQYKQVVDIANTEEELVESIRMTIKASQMEELKKQARQAIGKENSWDARWKLAASLIAGQAREKEDNVTF